MGCMMTIRDNALWAKHLEDAELRELIIALPQGRPITLLVDGTPVRFLKMSDGRDGRPTQGLKPAPEHKHLWDALQPLRGSQVTISLPDPYLVYLDGFLSEWNSAGDREAFDDL
jgi:hypothetical protein